MTLTISILFLLSVATIIIILVAKRINQQVSSREEFTQKLKDAFPDLKISETGPDTSFPGLKFSNGTDDFMLYTTEKNYVSITDEFLEITVKDESRLPSLKKKVEKFLNCHAVIEDNTVKAKIPGLKDYDRLFSFIQNYRKDKFF